MARIVAVFGPSRGVVREVDAGLVVGRSADAGLQLIDEKVSREHCRFTADGGGFTVEDLGSRNGTWLNGARLAERQRLTVGDEIGVGESVLVFEPTFETLRARDGDSTVLLTQAPAKEIQQADGTPARAFERAGELALRAATAQSRTAAARLLADAAQAGLGAPSVALLLSGRGALKPLLARPEGQALSVSRPLVELCLRQARPVAGEQAQSSAESDAHTTRVRRKPSHVVCAPLFSGGTAYGALCAARERPFSAEEIALAGALAGAIGAAVDARETVREDRFEPPVAESAGMREALRLCTAAARADSTVLLTGETGVGKEELARAIHALSSRSQGPFVAVNCGAIPSELAESELFGHEKGAFTGAVNGRPGVFEQADGGTLFLDEIGELPLGLQVKLLRVLQDRWVTHVGGTRPIAVDVRVVAATHRDLDEAVKKGEFREDLFWRLNVVRVHVPPLRERPDDVMPLAERFLARLVRTVGAAAEGFTPEAQRALKGCAWPGNARQLANALERALVLKTAPGPIGLPDLPPEVLAAPGNGASSASGGTLADLVRSLEREQILLALKRTRGVKVAAAEALGISRPTLDRKIDEYEIRWPE